MAAFAAQPASLARADDRARVATKQQQFHQLPQFSLGGQVSSSAHRLASAASTPSLVASAEAEARQNSVEDLPSALDWTHSSGSFLSQVRLRAGGNASEKGVWT